ncbi:MAG: hypothetical protein P1V97_04795 [Planctomycetota bacterium]|nr:hypothetical protein [Planctomycetota bacterium]
MKKSSLLPFFLGMISSLAVVGIYFEFAPAASKEENNTGKSAKTAKIDSNKGKVDLDKQKAKAKSASELLETTNKELKQELDTVKVKLAELEGQKKTWAAEKTQLDKEVLALKSAVKESVPEPAKNKLFRFGLKDKTPVFDKADWKQLGVSIKDMNKLMPELMKSIAKGEQPNPALMTKLQKSNMVLAAFAIQSASELEGTGPNGAFTHPAVMANLVHSLLEESGDPLSEEQSKQVSAFGDTWLQETANHDKSYNADSFQLEKMINEVDTKQRFIDGVRNILTDSQQALLFNAETTGRLGVDLLSPGLVYTQRRPETDDDKANLKVDGLKRLWSLTGTENNDAKALEEFNWIADAWLQASPLTKTRHNRRSVEISFPTVKVLQDAARAQLTAMKSLLREGRLKEEEVRNLKASPTLLMLVWRELDQPPK